MKKEIFVCDNCGNRKRLKSEARHWCEECKIGAPVEMRPARDKKIGFIAAKRHTEAPYGSRGIVNIRHG